jgi:pyruvate/2-oxoacid:ferredoxin oxidoreductase alpha subunit
MLDLSMEAFRLPFTYRNPVIIAADGYLGQMTGRVNLPETMVRPGLPDWAVYGDAGHRHNLMTSIYLAEPDLEQHNERLNAKYARMIENEQRATTFHAEDAEILIVACNTPARMAKGAVGQLRGEGIPVGLFSPITLWPFPIRRLVPLLDHVTDIVVVEGGNGQLEDELRLALSHAGIAPPPIHPLRHMGGVLPSEMEIVDRIRSVSEVKS